MARWVEAAGGWEVRAAWGWEAGAAGWGAGWEAEKEVVLEVGRSHRRSWSLRLAAIRTCMCLTKNPCRQNPCRTWAMRGYNNGSGQHLSPSVCVQAGVGWVGLGGERARQAQGTHPLLNHSKATVT